MTDDDVWDMVEPHLPRWMDRGTARQMQRAHDFYSSEPWRHAAFAKDLKIALEL